MSQEKTPAKDFVMSEELKKHILDNLATIRAWISTNAVLEASHVILEPVIKEYAPQFPEISLGGSCRECFIDMFRVCIKTMKLDETISKVAPPVSVPTETTFKKPKKPLGYEVGDIAKTSTGMSGKVLELMADGGYRVEGHLTGKLLPKANG